MPDNVIQISNRIGDKIFVIGGKTFDEFVENVDKLGLDYETLHGDFNKAFGQTTEQAVKNVVDAGLATPQPPAATATPQPTEAQQRVMTSNAPTCDHGFPAMQKSGTKNGRAWSGWFCAQQPKCSFVKWG